jgi:hypothetical protein
MLAFLIMMCGVGAGFVLACAERNRREMRPNGRAILLAGQLTMSAAATFAILLLLWAASA